MDAWVTSGLPEGTCHIINYLEFILMMILETKNKVLYGKKGKEWNQ